MTKLIEAADKPLLETSSNQLKISVFQVDRDREFVGGWKINKQRGDRLGVPFSVYFRDNEPVLIDGAGVPHPKLVIAAARAAWQNL
jgi:hypothetical protein